MKNQIENNYSGFKDKVTPSTKRVYDSLTNHFIHLSKLTTKRNYCLGLQKQWITFFKDGHLQIGENKSETKVDSLQIKKMIQETETIKISSKKLGKLKASKGIEGIYYTVDSTYTIAVIKNKTSFRDYVGVIVNSKTKLWTPNQVKLELKELSKDKFIAYTYYQDHSGHITEYSFDGTSLNNGTWVKYNATPKDNNRQQFAPIQTKKLTDKTFYIQIGSFDPWNSQAIDSVFKLNETILKSTPNLILDLRGNGGGVDDAFKPIEPYLYTKPIVNIGVDVIASKDNINSWKALLDYPELDQSIKDWVKTITDKMELNEGELVNVVVDDEITFESIEPFPKKVVILIDGESKSTTEQFLLRAIQSEKVTLIGQNSGGVLDYSNVRDAIYPDGIFTLYYPTTRSRRIDMGEGIDSIGIKPNIYLSGNKDWIIEAINHLKN